MKLQIGEREINVRPLTGRGVHAIFACLSRLRIAIPIIHETLLARLRKALGQHVSGSDAKLQVNVAAIIQDLGADLLQALVDNFPTILSWLFTATEVTHVFREDCCPEFPLKEQEALRGDEYLRLGTACLEATLETDLGTEAGRFFGVMLRFVLAMVSRSSATAGGSA